jgi:DNA-binding CsgD family transcriptional regulator
VRSPTKSSRSLAGGETPTPSAPACVCAVWWRVARQESGCSGRRSRCSQARLEHARVLVDLGAALRRANRRTEARESLREGIDLAQSLGAFRLAERANDEIAATGAKPRKVFPTGLDALTASELRVAQLAAAGMSNKEVAQTLFVTIKTVETHLSGAYRKLEISSRAQLDKALRTPTPNPASAPA